MLKLPALVLLAGLLPLQSAPSAVPLPVNDGPAFTGDGRLVLPEKYREWVFLTSGLDMSYTAEANPSDHSTFNNVFVNPGAYRVFQQTGHWPDGTALVLEVRGAEGNVSINKKGKTQSNQIMGFEVHVKDSAHVTLPGGWGFFSFDSEAPAKLTPATANCYSCHQEHAAVDTTFVQFYPTLQAAAKVHGAFSKQYLEQLHAARTTP